MTTAEAPPTIDVMKYQNLVKKVANQYLTSGLDFEDLCQIGNIGLLAARRRFEAHRIESGEFATFAWLCVRTAIVGAIRDNSGLIHVPKHTARARRQVIEGRCSLDDLHPTTQEHVRAAMFLLRSRIINEAALGIDTGYGLADIVVEDRAELPEPDEALPRVKAIIDGLPERQQTILAMSFPLDGFEPSTEREIGKAIGKSHSTVTRVKAEALAEIRARYEARHGAAS